MPGKMHQINPSTTIPTTPGTAAVRSSRLSCGKVGKAQIFTSARESSTSSQPWRERPQIILSLFDWVVAGIVVASCIGLLVIAGLFCEAYGRRRDVSIPQSPSLAALDFLQCYAFQF